MKIKIISHINKLYFSTIITRILKRKKEWGSCELKKKRKLQLSSFSGWDFLASRRNLTLDICLNREQQLGPFIRVFHRKLRAKVLMENSRDHISFWCMQPKDGVTLGAISIHITLLLGYLVFFKRKFLYAALKFFL